MNTMLEQPIKSIREALLLMSSLAERNFLLAVQALMERNGKLADQVEEQDDRIDLMEIEIDERIVAYMATRGPVGTDCRFALAASKISGNLERIGDESTTIARRTRLLNAEPPLGGNFDISGMVEITTGMLRESFNAFIEKKPEAIPEIVAKDQLVDELRRSLVRDLIAGCTGNEPGINRCINMIRVVECIERIADRAANIAEDIYFLHQGLDIRHGGLPNGGANTETRQTEVRNP